MDKFILEIPNAIPKELCNEIIKRFENDSRKENGVVRNATRGHLPFIDKSLKDSVELPIGEKSDWNDINNSMYEHMKKCLDAYSNFLKNNFDYGQTINPMDTLLNIQFGMLHLEIQKTPKDGVYAWHYDGGVPEHLANIIIYLNTLEYDEGGRTQFINGRKVIPEAGKVLIFPTTWTFVHSGERVKTDKSKYTCVSRIIINDIELH
jgi:hypothetical protein